MFSCEDHSESYKYHFQALGVPLEVEGQSQSTADIQKIINHKATNEHYV